MNYFMTLDNFLELPKEILKTSEQYDEYSELLRRSIYEQYDAKELKEKIIKKFNRFKDAKYLCIYPIENRIKLTSPYQERIGTPSNSCVSQIEKLVEATGDEEKWAYNFRNVILTVATKLTLQEARYLIDSFFSNKSEDIIAEKLGICRTTLQNVKKSCLVKVWIELKILDEDDR